MKFASFLSLVFLLTACTVKVNQPADSTAQPGDASAQTEQDPNEPVADALPVDPDVRVGKLDNGLTYYIRKHSKPAKRARLWLAVDAGSVLEDEDQKGLAHFVEHMAFNGTERFEKNTLIDYIERAGMDFGADLNAYTSFDETVYMLTVPTDDAKVVSTGMDILEDWSGALLFDPTEVDKERGVVVEEWRLGRGAQQRIFDEQWPIFLKGSKYAERKPIGEKEILEKAPPKTLKRFYKEWYRPDLMAVIVVGDVDPDKMEADIKKRFGDLKNPEKARERENVPVPILDKTRAALVTDKEAQFTQVSLAIKGPLSPVRTAEEYRHKLVENLFHGMLRARLDEIRQGGDAPFAFAFVFQSAMGRAVDMFQMFAMAKPGKAETTLEILTTEVERVRRHGFLAAELDRQKSENLRNFERAAAEKDKTDSRRYASEIVRHFLQDEAMPGRDKELELAKEFLPTITLKEVNALAEQWTSSKDRVVMASGAARDKMPKKKKMLAILDKVTKREIQPYTEEVSGASLLAKKPEPGSIKKEEKLDTIGTTVWTLSNGAKVIAKQTDFKNDEVLMRAFSPGGHSLAKDKSYHSASAAAGIVSNGGLGEHDATAIRKMTAGKVARVSPWINELEEGLRGSASPQDLELMMQLIHLTFTQPRKEDKALSAWKGSMETFVKNRDLNPQRAFFDELNAFTTKNHLRRRPMTMETLEKVKLDTAFDFYEERFADAGDFTFVFVGNVDESRLKDLAKQYLASLPTKGRKEKWKDVGVRFPKGVKEFNFKKGQDPKSFVYITFHGKAKWSPEAEDDLDMLAEVLDIRLREVLREEMGGVYGAFSWGRIQRRPKKRYSYNIGFGCAPENAPKLRKAVFDIIATIKKDGVGDDYIDKVKEQRRRKLETDLKKNRFWVDQLVKHYRYGTDAKKIVEAEEKAVKRVKSENVQKAATKYLGQTRVEGVLMPEADAKPTLSTAKK